MSYKIINLPADSTEISEMSASLHSDLELRYGKGSIEEFIEENKRMIIFFAAVDDENIAAACGALRHFDDVTAEIKRMYVKDVYRGRGLSKLILKELEDTALRMNYRRIVLETGLKQPEAMSLYEKFGYTKIKPYGKHKDDPDSVCYEKLIQPRSS
jgi:putative acetyltransferase